MKIWIMVILWGEMGRSGQYWTYIPTEYQLARAEGALVRQTQVFSPVGPGPSTPYPPAVSSPLS